MKSRLKLSAALSFSVAVAAVSQSAMASLKPLLLEGKETVYQRVLSKAEARVSEKPGRKDNSSAVTPFSVYYVYGYKKLGAQKWVQVGSDIHGTILGWMRETDLIRWNQGLTVAFRNPKGSERALLFESKQGLKALVEKGDKKAFNDLYKSAVSGQTGEASPVVAIQPDFHVDLAQEFYLAPILDHEDVFYGKGEAKLLQIATASQKRKAEAPKPKVVEPPQKDFTSGVVFVVDTTLSMGPYIDRTREAIRKIYANLTATDNTGLVRFGLVGYRDQSSEEVQLDYLSKTFATLKQGGDEESFFDAVADVKAATVSSHDFREDAYAGIKRALEDIEWESVDARYIVLITDAGPRAAGDERSSTGLDFKALRTLTQKQNIALTTLHLLTPQGIENHVDASRAYQELSVFPGVGSLYFDVETGDIEAFGKVVDALTGQISTQVASARKNIKTDTAPTAETQVDLSQDSNQVSEVLRKFARLGNALRMQYLKKKENAALPEVFNAWVLDRSLTNPEKKMLDVGVLLTRDQLGEMHSALNQVLETFEDGLIEPRGFLEDIKKLAATVSRDPKALTERDSGLDLASMGWMQEYIEGLPYQSQALTISLDDWESWSVKKQLSFIHGLQEKLAYYQAVYDHTDMWFSPAGGPVNGDSVIALSLDMLP